MVDTTVLLCYPPYFPIKFQFFQNEKHENLCAYLSYYRSVGKMWMNSKAIQAQGLEVQQIKSTHFQARLSRAITHTPYVLCR